MTIAITAASHWKNAARCLVDIVLQWNAEALDAAKNDYGIGQHTTSLAN
ncbi:MAG: hypothetical protein U0903_21455 [Planctomycetales bacterium]